MPKKVNRRDFVTMVGAGGAALAAGAKSFPEDRPKLDQPAKKGARDVSRLVTPKLDRIRVAFIGVGARGSGHVVQMMALDGVDVIAICDNHEPSAKASYDRVVKAGRKEPALYTKGEHDYRRMLERDDIDMVIIATPWHWHAPMAIDAMHSGKHAFTEVPFATTIDDLWALVDTCETTGKHCMMMENVNYGREELMVLNMCRLGVFGEILHGEAAYIHDLRGQMNEIVHGTGSWRTFEYANRNGNLYPTHGLGPVAHYMQINRGDRFDYMSSVSSNSRVREIYAKEHFPEGHQRRKMKFICGDINTSIIRTVKGKTVMVQWDEQLPRPYSRLNLLQGTKGVWGGFPDRVVIEGKTKTTEEWTEGAALEEFYKEYDHPLYKRVGEEGKRMGGHGGMDFVMLWRIVYCLRNGLPLDQSVYDSAAWSAVGPLSEWSVAHRGQSIDFPDFTRGKWKTTPELVIEV